METLFRDTKQYTGLGAACQCYTDAAMVRHVGLVLLGFVVLQHLRTHPGESLAAVKERWQLTLTHQACHHPTPEGLPNSPPPDRVSPVNRVSLRPAVSRQR